MVGDAKEKSFLVDILGTKYPTQHRALSRAYVVQDFQLRMYHLSITLPLVCLWTAETVLLSIGGTRDWEY